MNIVQFMDGCQLTACPLVIIPYMMSCSFVCFFLFCFFLLLLLFFCKQVFCVFSREFQHNSIKSVHCVPLDFFLRDHRRTSPFSNLFKILLDFGTELLLFPNCFISECSVFFCFLFCILISEIPPPSLSLRLKYQFFTRPPSPPPRHTRIIKPCTVLGVHIFQCKYQVHTRHRVAPRLLMKVKSRFNCDIM